MARFQEFHPALLAYFPQRWCCRCLAAALLMLLRRMVLRRRRASPLRRAQFSTRPQSGRLRPAVHRVRSSRISKQTGTSLPWTWVSSAGSQCQKPNFAQVGNGFRVYFSAPTGDLLRTPPCSTRPGALLLRVIIRGSAYVFYSNCDVGLTSGAKSTSPAVYGISCNFGSYSKAAKQLPSDPRVNGKEVLGPIQTVSGHI